MTISVKTCIVHTNMHIEKKKQKFKIIYETSHATGNLHKD